MALQSVSVAPGTLTETSPFCAWMWGESQISSKTERTILLLKQGMDTSEFVGPYFVISVAALQSWRSGEGAQFGTGWKTLLVRLSLTRARLRRSFCRWLGMSVVGDLLGNLVGLLDEGSHDGIDVELGGIGGQVQIFDLWKRLADFE